MKSLRRLLLRPGMLAGVGRRVLALVVVTFRLRPLERPPLGPLDAVETRNLRSSRDESALVDAVDEPDEERRLEAGARLAVERLCSIGEGLAGDTSAVRRVLEDIETARESKMSKLT